MRFKCADCRVPEFQDPRSIAMGIAGPRWWLTDTGLLVGEVCHQALKDGFCGRHAGMLAELVTLVVTEERARHVPAGVVEVRYIALGVEPYELLPNTSPRRAAEHIVSRVSQFVAGSALGATVDVDLSARRARVTLQLDDTLNPATTVIESHRLVHTSAWELATALRDRHPDRAR